MKKIEGSLTALVTPFRKDGSVWYERLEKLIDWQIEQGSDGIVVLGTTGEAATLSENEQQEVCRCAVRQAAGRVPVIAGCGSNNPQVMLEKALACQQAGADALLLSAPYYNKGNPEGIYRHFKYVADGVELPCILYNVPGRTACPIPEEIVAQLAVHPNVCGIKEASGDLSYAVRIARLVGEDFALYSGNDDQILPILALGGSGVISVWANLMPAACHRLVERFMAGDLPAARKLQLDHLELIRGLFLEVNPIPVKAAMNRMGLEVGGYRLPLYPMSEENSRRLSALLREYALI